MKAAGADLVFAIPHSGMSGDSSTGMDVSTSYDLAGVDDIDAILFGHAHRVFPSAEYEDVPEVDVAKGTIRGVPAVMAGYWGSHLGVIDLTLAQVDGAWQVVDSQSEARPIAMRVDGELTPLVEPNAAVLEAVDSDHMGALMWIRTPIGMIEERIHSYVARVQDDPSIQIVTDAQKAYVENLIQGTELEGLPVLSAGAPFKAGFGSAENYTDVPAGTVSIRNMADLYIYPNTVKVVKITGAGVREWLERSAGAFLQIDPNVTTPQPLLNDSFPSYNFDVLDGVTYQIDVTQPSRYDGTGTLVAPDAHRIVNLMLKLDDTPVTDEQIFLVATNNYRASGGGNFPGLGPDVIVIDAPDENRQVLANYIADQESVNPQADGNWSFAPIASDVTVEFETSPDAAALAEAFPRLEPTAVINPAGYQVYHYDFSP
jgi:2',3'-cyclic-nucleotide 2'-phosphodiesterase/3'-nucleotidase